MSLPAPLVDPDTDVRHYGRCEMPMNIYQGPGFATLTPDAFRAQAQLVHRSWWEVPAGSVPTLDETLAQYAGFGHDVESWLIIKDECLGSGWVLCNDRRYHFAPMVETVENAYSLRRKKDRATNTRVRRARTKEALVGYGCVEERLTGEVLDHVYETLDKRGQKTLRGAERADALRMIASDMRLLPQEAPPNVVDARLDIARGRRGGT